MGQPRDQPRHRCVCGCEHTALVHVLGAARYPTAKRLLINADCGGSKGNRVRLWKRELQVLADELGIAITVSLRPPGTSKWNRIEHKLFPFTPMNGRAKPLISYQGKRFVATFAKISRN